MNNFKNLLEQELEENDRDDLNNVISELSSFHIELAQSKAKLLTTDRNIDLIIKKYPQYKKEFKKLKLLVSNATPGIERIIAEVLRLSNNL